ncbi:NAD-dependent epimerase/dehydratase family protein [Actinomadura oligospora]|uniref:NAD-dependent epimerase/dehydratase family protein n=1 Tax=Actinomadura oligospora TaxID=111804 RepID=UPI00047D9F57|nr:NAD-dependent epimerase/dehydratase family protein [Actinomadura oligospora]
MRIVVTGAAGFIGSRVVEAAAEAGHEVLAVDAPDRALAPGAARRTWDALTLPKVELDLASADLRPLTSADVVVHLAGRPGIRSSWGAEDDIHRDNVVATRRVLAAAGGRVVVASSSSVYGSAGRDRPTREDDPLAPASPYAVSKVAAERLARRCPDTVVLRYFSVYGPGQRPDMAFHRFTEAALAGRPLPVFGDGRKARSFTHVDDVVAATLAAVTAGVPGGTAINVGHPEPVTVRTAIGLLGRILDVRPDIENAAPVAGDADRTWADPSLARDLLGWTPRIALADGLADQIAWHREIAPAVL